MAIRKPSPAEHQRRQDAAEAKLQAAQQRIVDGVAALVSGDDWATYLRFAAKFHNYSFNNTVLIMTQAPAATYVAGYQTWLSLGRQVRKGETGIAILAPVLARRDTEPTTEPGGEVSAGGAAQTRDGPQLAGRRIVGARTTTIFDVAQTDPATPGTELPLIRPALLQGDVEPQLWNALEAVARTRGYTVERGPCGGANGVTHFWQRRIQVRDDVSPLQAVKTLAHELGHVLLHDRTADPDGAGEPMPDCRGLIEVEAESVACMTLSSQGLDSAEYTFPYVALWASNGRSPDPEVITAAIQATANRVITATRTITASFDTAHATTTAAATGEEVAAARERAATALRELDPPRTGSTPDVTATTVAAASRTRPVAATEVRLDQDVLSRLYAVNQAALTYFTDFGRQQIAVDYLRTRGVTPPTEYRIGYAPIGGGLPNYLETLGFPADQQIAAGVARRDYAGRLRDVFRDRVVVPVVDGTGVCGFVGRALRDDPAVPRYLNTAATPLFDKSTLLYGCTERLELLRQGATPVLVEGFIDVLAIAQHTPRHVPVAVLGTAFTHRHAERLTESLPQPQGDPATGVQPVSGKRLIEALDPDDAGRDAAATVAEILIPQGWRLRTPQQIPGADPAELAHQHGAQIVEWLDPRRCRDTLSVVVDHKLHGWGELRWAEQRVAAYHHVRDYLAAHFPAGDAAAALNRAADLTGMPRTPAPARGEPRAIPPPTPLTPSASAQSWWRRPISR